MTFLVAARVKSECLKTTELMSTIKLEALFSFLSRMGCLVKAESLLTMGSQSLVHVQANFSPWAEIHFVHMGCVRPFDRTDSHLIITFCCQVSVYCLFLCLIDTLNPQISAPGAFFKFRRHGVLIRGGGRWGTFLNSQVFTSLNNQVFFLQ